MPPQTFNVDVDVDALRITYTYHVHAVLEGNNWAVVGKQPVSPSPKNTDTQAYYHPELQGPSREEDTDRLCHLNCRALLGLAS